MPTSSAIATKAKCLSLLYEERGFEAHSSRPAFAFVVIVLEVAIVWHDHMRGHTPFFLERKVGLSFSGIIVILPVACLNEC